MNSDWVSDVASFAPVETRVRDHDLTPSNEKCEKADRRDPVRHANKRIVPGSLRILQRSGVRHVGSIARRTPDGGSLEKVPASKWADGNPVSPSICSNHPAATIGSPPAALPPTTRRPMNLVNDRWQVGLAVPAVGLANENRTAIRGRKRSDARCEVCAKKPRRQNHNPDCVFCRVELHRRLPINREFWCFWITRQLHRPMLRNSSQTGLTPR